MRKLQSLINDETLTVISSGLCLFLSATALHFGYSPALGAFIMGSILAVTPQAAKIEHLVNSLRNVFAAVFFVSVGMLINPEVLFRYLPQVVLISIVTIVGKILASGIGALVAGQTLSNSIKIGFGMAQIGEFSFIIVGLGGSVSPVNEALYPIIVAVSAITTFTTPYLISFAVDWSDAIEHKTPRAIKKALGEYRSWLQETTIMETESHIGQAILRSLINFIAIAIIYTAVDVGIAKAFGAEPVPIGLEILLWIATFIVASPFIWALLHHIWEGEASHPYLKALMYLILGIELLILMVPNLTHMVTLIPVTVAFVIFMNIYARHIENLYMWLETQFIRNLRGADSQGAGH
jgi:CPA2 family monovalent cation:H+ antiporter-2